MDKKLLFILIMFLPISMLAQSRIEVTGKVTSSVDKQAIPGVTVVLKGTTSGTITSVDGEYAFASVPSDGILIFSFVGMATKEVPVNSTQVINVSLDSENIGLEDVVVVGFGTQKKVNLTGSVGIATAEDIQSRPVVNATQALQGLVPGLQITTGDGSLDQDMNISIRGQGTIGEGSSGSPLILIDGMEGDLNTVNPEDIENISVLKDAAASSIYGSRAPFGVILVTTKKGTKGKTRVNYNNSFRFTSPVNLPKQMDSYTFANYFNSAAINKGSGALFSEATMERMLDFQAAGGTSTGGILSDGKVWGVPDPFTTGFANTDWYREIYKDNSFSQEHNLSMNGGGDRTTYYASMGYLDQNGVLDFGSDGIKRYNLTAKINTELYSWLKFNFSTRFTRNNNWRPSKYDDFNFYQKLGRQTWPNLAIYDENGYLFNSNATTPAMQLAMGGDRTAITDRAYYQGTFIIQPIKGWDTHVELNYNTTDRDIKQVDLPAYNHDVEGNIVNTNGTSSLYQDFRKQDYMNVNIYSNYSLSLNESHNFKLMFGFQSERFRQRFFSSKAYGLLMNDMAELDLVSGLTGAGEPIPPEVEGNSGRWATAGFFGRVNYDYEGRYLAEVNMRYDGSSRFREGDRWGFFPSMSLGWNIAYEDFWEGMSDKIGLLKLRASYGQLGNQNTDSWYPTYRTMTISPNSGGWLQNGAMSNTAKVDGLIASSLTWETVSSWNVGLDWGAFDNRLTGSLDIFTRYTQDMVGPAPQLPSTLGIAQPKTNNTDLKTTGWELSISWNDQLENGLVYGGSFMVSDAKTVVTRYPGNPTNSINNYFEGGVIGDIWGFETLGIAKTQEEMDAHIESVGGNGQNALGSEWSAGDIMYKDLDGLGGINKGEETLENPGDLKVIGNETPRYQFGLDLHANFKGFDFRAFFQGVMKREVFIKNMHFWGVYNRQWWSTGLAEHNDYFRAESIGLEGHEIPANIDSYYPRPIFNTSKNQQEQTRYLQDASYIRLKNLQFGYTVPRELSSKAGMSKLRIYVSGENVWTGTNLSKLFDPEIISNHYPMTKTWSMGLNVTF